MKYLLHILLFISAHCGFAQVIQDRPQRKEHLSIGDTLPSVTLNKIYNYIDSSANIRSFYNKLLIIDFWATWCAPCVAELPKLDSLHQKYSDQITILPVSDEKFEVVNKVIEGNARLKHLKLPFVVEDTSLNPLFRHTIIPHEVWINKEGIIIAITSQLEVTEENIKQFLVNPQTKFAEKKDQLDFDLSKALMKFSWQDNSLIEDSALLDYSVVMRYRPGIPSSARLWITNLEESKRSTTNSFNVNGITCTDVRIISLYIIGFDLTYSSIMVPFLNPHRVILDVYDSTRYMEHTDTSHDYTEAYRINHDVNYEMKISKALPDTLFAKKMLDDLNRHFPLRGKIVRKEMTCWVIAKKAKSKVKRSSVKKEAPLLYYTANTLGIKNKNLNVLIRVLNAFYNMEPILDESGLEDPVNIELKFQIDLNKYPDIAAIKRSLNNYGLDMIQAKRNIDMLYLTDKPEN